MVSLWDQIQVKKKPNNCYPFFQFTEFNFKHCTKYWILIAEINKKKKCYPVILHISEINAHFLLLTKITNNINFELLYNLFKHIEIIIQIIQTSIESNQEDSLKYHMA